MKTSYNSKNTASNIIINDKKTALRALVAGLIVFMITIIYFFIVLYFGKGQSTGMPLVQVKQNDEWMLIRSDYDQNLNPNITGYDFVYNESTHSYDLILHYNTTNQ